MRYESLTLDRLKEMLDFDPATGVFTWKKRPYHNSRKKIGDVAGVLKTMRQKQYRYIGIDSRTYLASQLAFLWVHGRWARGQVGAKNGDPSDLRPINLVEMMTAPGEHDLGTREGRASYRKAYRSANEEAVRDRHFRRYYGIGLDEYQRMLVEQKGGCAICGQPERHVSRWQAHGNARWLSVDHDHDTGAVRGLLCSDCNFGLGSFLEDPQRLRAAAAYIESHAARLPLKKETA